MVTPVTGEKTMADFVSKSTVKSAERVLATPFASKAAMNTIIGTILADNPWGCTPYLSGGENLPAVQKSTENYTGTVIYESDGAAFVSSSVIGQGQTYATHLFTTSLATLMRELQVKDGHVRAVTVADSAGPMGIDEYSGQAGNQTPAHIGCLFETGENRTNAQDEIRYTGLLMTGEYVSSRDLKSSEISAATMVNGTGMILARASSQDQNNETTHASDVAGRLNMTEQIVFGGEE